MEKRSGIRFFTVVLSRGVDYFAFFSHFFSLLWIPRLKSRKKRVFSCIGYSFTRTGHTNRLRHFFSPARGEKELHT